MFKVLDGICQSTKYPCEDPRVDRRIYEEPTQLKGFSLYLLRSKLKLCFFFQWLRFGKITTKVIDRIEGTVCELEYRGRFNKVVGYWAYGYFDPELPFKENCFTKVLDERAESFGSIGEGR